jgi:two-component system, response regulator
MDAQTTNILVVEDDANDSFMLIRQIEKAQIDDHVTVIGDGKEAFEFLQKAEHLPLAVFLDLRLPGLNGLELLEKIRAEAALKGLPVIVMTGSINPQDENECMRLGVTAYLQKPISLTTFIKTVSHLFPEVNIANQPH